MAVVMGAPNVVRGGSHSGNISARDLAAAGLLDILSSDYAPVSLLHAAFLLHGMIGMPLPEAVAKVSLNPAQALGLDDRGEIAPGRRADLVRVQIDRRHAGAAAGLARRRARRLTRFDPRKPSYEPDRSDLRTL